MKVRSYIIAGDCRFIETLDGDLEVFDGDAYDLEFIPYDLVTREAVAEQGIGD